MLAPKAIPSGSPPVKSAAAARPRSITSSAAAEVANAPPRLAFDSRRQSSIASSTSCGTCEPPGPVEVGGAAGERGEALAQRRHVKRLRAAP